MNKKGFVTLMVVIIISGIISATLFSMLLKSYGVSSSGSDSKLKEESRFSANSCVAAITILLAEFGDFSDDSLQVAGVPNCKIHFIEITDGGRILGVESEREKFHTFLRAKIDIHSNKILSIEEVKLLK